MQIKAFTVMEMLLVLFMVSFLLRITSLQVSQVLIEIKETLFFKRFEMVYRDCQQSSLVHQEARELRIEDNEIKSYHGTVTFPESISCEENLVIKFDEKGGNSSLKSILFHASLYDVRYQLYLGNGKFKKTKD